MGSNLRAVAGTNTDDVMKLFGGYGQAKTSAANALSLVGGFGQPPSLADVMAQSIGAVNEQAKSALMTPAVPTVGAPPLIAPATTPAISPARTAAAGAATRSTPLPTLSGLPAPPSVMDALPVPVYDEKRAQSENENALRLASLVPALSALFNIGGGGGQAMGPGLIADALAGADAGTKEREARRLKTYGLEQDAQNILNDRTQRRYGQDADVVQEANRNANTLYADQESASRADAADETKRAGIDQKDSAAIRSAQARNYRTLLSLEPAGQEAALSAPGGEAKYGVLLKYDANGNFQPYRTQKDVTAENKVEVDKQKAVTQAADIKSKIAFRAGILTVNGRKATVDETNAYNRGLLTDSQVDVNSARITKMAADTSIAQQRATDYHAQVGASVSRIQAAITKLKAGGKDPGEALLKIDKEIAASQKRRSDALLKTKSFKVDDNPDVKAFYGGMINDETRLIEAARKTRAQIQSQMPTTVTPEQARVISSRSASRSSGTVGPAKVVVKPTGDVGYDDWLKRGKGLGVPVGK